jgi:hypothetical protein
VKGKRNIKTNSKEEAAMRFYGVVAVTIYVALSSGYDKQGKYFLKICQGTKASHIYQN